MLFFSSSSCVALKRIKLYLFKRSCFLTYFRSTLHNVSMLENKQNDLFLNYNQIISHNIMIT